MARVVLHALKKAKAAAGRLGARFLLRAAVLLGAFSFAQPLSAQITPALPRAVSASVWVYIEEMPGNEPFSAQEELRKLAAFVLSGMVFGWRFEYAPADSTRGVSAYFSLEPLGEIDELSAGFSVSDIETRDQRLYCRAEFILDEAALNSARLWNSVLFKSCRGRGYGERRDEMAGIYAAFESAARNAVHEHARTLEKNRPKEIRGEIKFKEEPRISATGGRFAADAEFLINVKEIVPYTVF